MTMNVGDLLYVLDIKTHTVVPCKIIEKVSSIRIEGEEIHHIVESPTGKNFKLESYKNPWFVTIEDSRDFLKKAAEKLITDTIQKAQKVAESSFGETKKNTNSDVFVNEMTDDLNKNVQTISSFFHSFSYISFAGF